MPDDPFVRQLSPTKSEPAEWLVYADWLEEHSDPRAEFIRNLVDLRAEESVDGRLERSPKLIEMTSGFDKDWLQQVGYVSSPFDVTDESFEKVMQSKDELLLLQFWAPWCGPCKMLAPTMKTLATKIAGWGRVGKVNVDEQLELSKQHEISAIPAVLIFSGASLKTQLMGLHTEDQIVETICEHTGLK